MADKRYVNRIYRAHSTDKQMVKQFRETNERALRTLRESLQPDTFLGRKTQEPFPPEEPKE